MKKLTTFFLLASSFIIGVMVSAQNANANPIVPGGGGGGGAEEIPNQNELIVYGVIGGIIIVIIVVSVIALCKIRKKNVNK